MPSSSIAAGASGIPGIQTSGGDDGVLILKVGPLGSQVDAITISATGVISGILRGGAVSVNPQTLTGNVVLATGESGSAVGPLAGGGFSITGQGTARFVVF